MTIETERKANVYAKEMGYEKAFFRLKWNGYDVYEPVYSKELSYIGLPLMILEKNGKFRMTTPEEAFDILDITADLDEKIREKTEDLYKKEKDNGKEKEKS